MGDNCIGLIVNPVAGMGGAVGLKGTDGCLAGEARRRGAQGVAAERASKTLRALKASGMLIDWLACEGEMGAPLLSALGFRAETVYKPACPDTTGSDTRRAARIMADRGARLILFAGGDGTATDLLAAVGQRVPVLGIPAGVKMHSAVFAVTPRAAADVVGAWLTVADSEALLADCEVMDRPAGESSEGSPELLGYVRTPVLPRLVAQAKAAGPVGSVEGACAFVTARVREAGSALLGPGTTLRQIKRACGFDGTLLGVDAVSDGRLAAADLTAAQALDFVRKHPDSLLVVGVVGGQGFLFGRGNQQCSPAVLREVGKARILVVASLEKLATLPERRLYVDSGDDALDAELSGYLPVVVGYRRSALVPVGLPDGLNPDQPDGGASAEIATLEKESVGLG
ncbi:MAG: NAD(+)/NADH kinase [Gammaproteobacteria bacterium]|nr:NAD(+)/NADH kinase [Gammaproteobacteria bacterium]MDH4254052.1 NAD(+)/NADH kinase [Gammaproteobacteria bacterium]MDH5309527.1 NAD(+)/NADH kinase [Gammaproteobacteria bacterium]